MKDIFADYGIVGTTIIKENKDTIEIQYFAISCKVEGRNIGRRVIEFVKKQQTKRLILRRFKNTDAEEIFNNWLSDPEVSKYMVWNHQNSIEETQKWLEKCIAKYEKLDLNIKERANLQVSMEKKF